MKTEQITILDTTLRDGDQAPGAAMAIEDKIAIALQLEKAGIDVIEAGFPVSSPANFRAVQEVASRIEKSAVSAFARSVEGDIRAAGEALAPAANRRIHTFLATSPIHMKHKLNMAPEEVVRRAVDGVRFARSFTDNVQFSCEDAGRSDIGFLKEICTAVAEAGATTVNVPDTVGYMLPFEVAEMVRQVKMAVGTRAVVAFHGHDDLGYATANSLFALMAGAGQIEVTVNGLGERAGNTPLEELVMTLAARPDRFAHCAVNVDTRMLVPLSRMVARATGIAPQPNKAIVGRNAFRHESGIHQDGMMKRRDTYEIISPETVGGESALPLGRHSGSRAFKNRVESLGIVADGAQVEEAFRAFKVMADNRKEVDDESIAALFDQKSA